LLLQKAVVHKSAGQVTELVALQKPFRPPVLTHEMLKHWLDGAHTFFG
jgi:hypothetical protein